jgi:hypothetical protein
LKRRNTERNAALDMGEAAVGEVVLWLVIAGIPATLIVLTAATALTEHHRIRIRRTALRGRLFR